MLKSGKKSAHLPNVKVILPFLCSFSDYPSSLLQVLSFWSCLSLCRPEVTFPPADHSLPYVPPPYLYSSCIFWEQMCIPGGEVMILLSLDLQGFIHQLKHKEAPETGWELRVLFPNSNLKMSVLRKVPSNDGTPCSTRNKWPGATLCPWHEPMPPLCHLRRIATALPCSVLLGVICCVWKQKARILQDINLTQFWMSLWDCN